MEGHCHSVVNIGMVTDRRGTPKLELADTRPECSCGFTNTHTHDDLDCLSDFGMFTGCSCEPAGSNINTSSIISNFLHQRLTIDWLKGTQSKGKLFTMACTESYTEGNIKSIWTRVTTIQEVISTQQTHQAAASSLFSDKLLIMQLCSLATNNTNTHSANHIWKDLNILMEFGRTIKFFHIVSNSNVNV